MTLTRYNGQYEEIFRNAILWWTGRDQTITGFPIIPTGVTVTPAGTFTNDLDLGNNTLIKTFDGSTNYLSLTDNDAWAFYNSDFTVSGWIKFASVSAVRGFLSQYVNDSNYINVFWNTNNTLVIGAQSSGSATLSYNCPLTPIVGTWYYITIQRSGSSCSMLIDGVSKTVTTGTAFTGTTNIAAPLTIGVCSNLYYSSGSMKDIMIFTRALSQSEIMLVMRKTHPVSGEDNFYPTLSGIRGVE